MTPSFLHRIYKAAGVDAAKADAFAATPAALKPLGDGQRAWPTSCGVQSTPTILVGKRGGKLTAVQADPTDVSAFKAAIDGALGQA